MMKWIVARWAEPSTKIVVGAAAAGVTHLIEHPPTSTAEWVSVGIGFLTVIAGAATPESGSPDAH